jgi:hypothetical protein
LIAVSRFVGLVHTYSNRRTNSFRQKMAVKLTADGDDESTRGNWSFGNQNGWENSVKKAELIADCPARIY